MADPGLIEIGRPAWEAIRQALSLAANRETGGILVGPVRSAGKIVVTQATGPGPDVRQGWTILLRDARWHDHELSRLKADSSAHWIGEWHSHTWGSPFPSWRDIMTARHLLDHQLGVGRFVLLIVSPKANGVEAGACSITKDAVAPLRLANAPPDAAIRWRTPTWRWRHESAKQTRMPHAFRKGELWDLKEKRGEPSRGRAEKSGAPGAPHKTVLPERAEGAAEASSSLGGASGPLPREPRPVSSHNLEERTRRAGGQKASGPRRRAATAVDRVGRLIRRRPWTAAAVGFALGFVASGVLEASGSRRAAVIHDAESAPGYDAEFANRCGKSGETGRAV